MKNEPEITRVTAYEAYSFSKDKVPRALSYPLKRSLLDTALRSASVYEAVWYVQYYGHQNNKLVMRAVFSPEQGGNLVAGRVSIYLWTVPAQQRQTTEQVLVNGGLHRLCDWIAKTQSEGNVWRGVPHTLELRVHDGALSVVEQ